MSLNWKEINLILEELDLPGSQIQKPTKQKGKRNMPKYLPETCLCLAKMLDMEPEAAAAQLWENANRFFNLPNE